MLQNWEQQFKIIEQKFSLMMGIPLKKVSQQKLADFLGVTKSKVRCWQQGQNPNAEDLATMARKLNLSPRWLLLGEGEPVSGAAIEPQPSEPQEDEGDLTSPLARELHEVARVLRRADFDPQEIKAQLAKIVDKHTRGTSYTPQPRDALRETGASLHEDGHRYQDGPRDSLTGD